MIRALYWLFVLSGAAGLIYESIWTRYLGLFVGHDAYAQIIVLVIFLGGMSLGALGSSRLSDAACGIRFRLRRGRSCASGASASCSTTIFQAATAGPTPRLPRAGGDRWTLTAAKWALAGALILPQSVLLGMTFPLMSAGVLRLHGGQPRPVAVAALLREQPGGRGGVLVAGFYLVGAAGLPGTLLAAAMLNLIVAAATIAVIAGSAAHGGRPAPVRGRPVAPPAATPDRSGLGGSCSSPASGPRSRRSSTRSPGSGCWRWSSAAPRTPSS